MLLDSVDRRGRILVLAGVNGAGKSSVLGTALRGHGGRYFNPDEAARTLRAEAPAFTSEEANAGAWELGRRQLERAIAARDEYAFETTLGGRTIAALLGRALDAGLEVATHYVGLDAPERHIARVRERAARGGHDIPEAKIRERYTTSRAHLVELLPRLTELVVYDNSAERDPATGAVPTPTRLLDMAGGRVRFVAPREDIPAWAAPIVAAALISHARPAARQAATNTR